MPNTQTAILDVIFSQALQTLREYCVMPRVVNTDFANVPAGQGDSVNVRVPLAQAVTDVSPNQGPVTPVDNTYEARTLKLDRWRKAGFYLTDKERGELAGAQVPMQLNEAVKALANDINGFILSQYKKVWSSVGSPGTAVFDGVTWNAATTTLRNGLAAMSRQVVPNSDRRLVLHPVSYSGALGVEGFVLADQRGGTAALNDRALGRLLGLDWYEDQQVPGHAGTALSAGAASVNGVNAAGATTVSIAKLTNTAPLIEGDILTIASGPAAGQYVVRTAVTLAVGNTSVDISPPLRGATAGGESVTLLAPQSRVNLMFHRDAFHFASRPLVSDAAADMMRSIADPVSGVALRMEMVRQNKQDYIEFDVLYGATSFRPELAVRVCE
jgi:hypothetical protein